MPRRKSAKNIPICPWLSAKLDNREGRFIQIGNSLFLSHKNAGSEEEGNAFLRLPAGTRFVYLALTLEAGGKSTVKFSHSAAKKYGISPTTYDRSMKQLRDAGFVEQVLDENRSQFATNVFRFINQWKEKTAPQNGGVPP